MSITQYEQNLRQSIEQHQRIIDAGLPESAQAQEIINQFEGELSRIAQQGSGNSGSQQLSYDEDFETRRMREMRGAQERQRQINAIETLRGVMNEYGLGSLMGRIESFVRDGYEADAVMALIRTTPEYEQRFPAMKKLAQKQRAITEAAYIEFERNASQLERAYGLPAGMLGKDTVTNLIGNEVSANELEERVTLAAAAAYQTPREMRETFSRLYGIEGGALTAYFLDPEKAMPLLNKQFAASTIATEAEMQQFRIEAPLAETLVERGVSQAQAREGFGQVSRRAGLTEGRGDVVSREQLVSGTLLQDDEAQRALERAAGGRQARFMGGGSYVTTQQGVTGLGSSTT